MDAFEDNTVTSGAADPAAEFLAREQEELGELGEELGIKAGGQINMEGLSLEDRQEIEEVNREGKKVSLVFQLKVRVNF